MMLRNTSEELMLRSLIDGSSASASHMAQAGPPPAVAAGLENIGMGFQASVRANSEELFNSWIANSEPHVRQHGKMSSELAALLAHQQQASEHHDAYEYQSDCKRGNYYDNRRTQQDDYPSLQTLSWFQSSQPMTRSRSTELRKRYLELQRHAAQQGYSFAPETYEELPAHMKPGSVPAEHSFLPYPDNLHQQNTDQASSVSTVVNMLKGTLERKKVSTRNKSLSFMDDHTNVNNNVNTNVQEGNFMFRVTTPSESSNGGGENSCPTTPIHLFHDQQTGRAISNGELPADEQQKRQAQLSRAGSITSSGRSAMNCTEASSDVSTKKRRVERKRMMVEAKGRSSVPPIPSDMQAAVKRSEALEKEVRSLKLNLSFMNRKDSEQTKRIEELEKQNEELLREKNKLTEELDQVMSGRTTWQ